jgi:NAD(P)-dependent dehydrogenase (short-subunit alcohol dehydrogenase family)
MLGEAGAIVYCTGRSSRTQPNTSNHVNAGRPETIEETAEMVTAAGGTGIPVRVDHTVDREVAAFLNESPADGRAFVESWIWPHVLTAWHAAKLMRAHAGEPNRSGLIVELVEQDNVAYHGAFYFDMMEMLLKRLVFALANDLGQSGITAVAVGPGFMRTEAILAGFGVTEATWRDALNSPQATAMGWGGSETPCFVGRAVAALAADANVGRKNGGIYTARALADEYGFTDITGARPDHAALDAAVEQAQKTFLAPMMEASSLMKVDWKMTAKTEG